jgi:antitoxin component of RelBE/YafQ-DinJ toxin-antitoxin module
LSENLETYTFEVDEELEKKAREVCEDWGVTLEDMTRAFMKFCVTPENEEIVRAYFRSEENPNEEIQRAILNGSLKIAKENR